MISALVLKVGEYPGKVKVQSHQADGALGDIVSQKPLELACCMRLCEVDVNENPRNVL